MLDTQWGISFIQKIVTECFVSGIVLGSGAIMVNKIDMVLVLTELAS